MRTRQPEFGWGGLNTRANETGLPLLECAHLQDMRVVGMDLVQRLGIVHVGQVAGDQKAMDFDGTNQCAKATVDSRVWALGTQFTFEAAVAAGTLADSEAALSVGSTTACVVVDLASSKWRVRIWDSGATLSTLTSTTNASTTDTDTLQVVRDGASLTLRLNGTSEDTDTMSATNSLRTPAGEIRAARSTASDYFDGIIDYLRLFSFARDHHRDRLVRHPAPRAPYVLCDYDFNESAGGLVYDRSRYENHLQTQNSPSEATSLCHNPAPVRALSMGRDENNRRQLLIAAGGNYYLAAVG